MQNSYLEPGFLQVFRIYAWLRLATLLMIPIAGLHLYLQPDFPLQTIFSSDVDLYLPILLMVMNIVVVLGCLYWSWLQKRLGRYYAPAILIITTVGLVVELNLFGIYGVFNFLTSFLFVPLILTAWQFKFRYVVLYTIGTAALELALSILFPAPLMFESLYLDSKRIIYFSLMGRSMTFLLLGYVVSRLVGAQREQRKALARANQKLVRNAATLEKMTISRERVRISRELHDTLAHSLSALAVQLDAVLTVWNDIPEKARQMLTQMLDTTRTGLDETRRTLSALRATPLEEMGLVLALHTTAEDFANRNSLNLEFASPEDLDAIPTEVEHVFYRIAQEAFENTAKHASANNLSVKINQDPNSLSMCISDDGCGFVPNLELKETQLGVRGMYERAELIDADLLIESKLGAGTNIHLILERKQ